MNRLGLGAGNPKHRKIVTPEYKYWWFWSWKFRNEFACTLLL